MADEAKQGMGLGKIVAGIASGFITTYLMNQASLHGVNFETMGVSSEVVKSAINGTIIGSIVAFTPQHFVASIVDAIRWIRRAGKQISDATHDPLPPEQ